jgi:hypothetical protein
MEKWKEKEPPDIKKVISYINMDDPIKKLIEDLKTRKFIGVN